MVDDNRDVLGGTLGGTAGHVIRGDDDVDAELHHLDREFGEPLGAAAPPAPFDGEILAFDIAEIIQSLPKSVGGWGWSRRGRRYERDPRHLPRLLSFYGGQRAAEAQRKGDGERRAHDRGV